MNISNLPDRAIKVMIIKKLTKLGRRMDKHSENINKEIESIRKYQPEVTELKNTINELKNTLESFNSRLDEAEQQAGRQNNGTHQGSATDRKKKF